MHMEVHDIWSSSMCREVPVPADSYTATISLRIIHALDMRKNQHTEFAVSGQECHKTCQVQHYEKGYAEAGLDSAALYRYGEQEDAGYMGGGPSLRPWRAGRMMPGPAESKSSG